MNFPDTNLSMTMSGLIFLLSLSIVSVGTKATSSEIPSDWIEVSAGDVFSLMAPPGTEFHPLQGIDSFVGTFKTPDFELSFDYGLYSNRLDDLSTGTDPEVHTILIDDKNARIVTMQTTVYSKDHSHFIGVYIPDLKQTMLGSLSLSITCSLENDDLYPIVEQIYKTIRFK